MIYDASAYVWESVFWRSGSSKNACYRNCRIWPVVTTIRVGFLDLSFLIRRFWKYFGSWLVIEMIKIAYILHLGIYRLSPLYRIVWFPHQISMHLWVFSPDAGGLMGPYLMSICLMLFEPDDVFVGFLFWFWSIWGFSHILVYLWTPQPILVCGFVYLGFVYLWVFPRDGIFVGFPT